MKKSGRTKILLISILLLPSLIYFFFELTHANFKKMPYYGPKKYDSVLKDTIYYTVPDNCFLDSNLNAAILDTNKYPVFLIAFVHNNLRNEGYKLKGLLDFTQYKPEKLNLITTFLVSAYDSFSSPVQLKQELKIKNKDVMQLYLPSAKMDSINTLFFKEKPMYVFDHFFVLIDKKRRIRSYFDPNLAGEVKRMIGDFEHLKLRDEKAKLEKKNKIEKK